MYCHNCGKEIENDVKHCPHCGAQQRTASQTQTGKTPVQTGGSQKGGGTKKPVVFLGAAVAVVVVLAVVIMLVTGKRTLQVMDYVNLQVEGLSSEGTGKVSFDTDRLLADIGEKKALTEREKEDVEALIADAMKDFSMSKSSQLANGDEVTVESNVDKKLLNSYGIALKNGSAVLTVSDLIEIKEIHLNDYMEMEFSGFEGNGYAYINTDYEKLKSDVEAQVRALAEAQEAEKFISEELGNYLYSFYLDVQPTDLLKNGDEVKASISMDNSEISKYGIRFIWEDMTETAEGLLPTHTVALTDYLNCEFSGYDGAGYANVTLDKEKLTADLQSAFEEEGRGVYGPLQEETDLAADLENAVNIISDSRRYNFTTTLDKDTALANGDTITLECTYEQEPFYLYQIGVYLEGGTKELTVENLEEPQEVDLASALTVSFSGVCPNVRAELTVDYDQPYVSMTSLWYMSSSERIIAGNGDVYEGEITYDEQELLENGYRVTNNKYSYEIAGLDTYEISAEPEKIIDLSKAFEDYAKQKAVNASEEILEYAGSDGWLVWNESELALDSFKIAYKTSENDTENRLYLVYHVAVPVKGLNRRTEQQDVFLVLRFYDIKETPEGEILYEENWNTSLFMTAGEAQDFVSAEIADMEDAEILKEYAAAEELVLDIADTPEISGEEVTQTQAATGEFADNVRNQAAVYVTYEGHIYARYDMNLSWKLANTFCQAAGGHLATVTSEREKAVIEKLLEDAPFSEYWIGATDADWEGGWQWVTGEPFDWTDWDSGQPDNSTYEEEGENYLEMGRGFGNHWNDNYGENTDGGFILEIEPAADAAVNADADTAKADADEETAKAADGEQTDAAAEDADGEQTDAAAEDADDKQTDAAAEAANDEQADAAADTAYLADLTPMASNRSGIETYLTDPYGNDHFYSLYLDAAQRGSLTYDLNGAWSKLTGTISTWTEADSGCIFEIAIWGDDTLLYSKYNYQKGDAAIPFAVDVKGVEKLYIQTNAYGNTYNGYLFLSEGRLTADGTEAVPEETQEPLDKLALISAGGYEAKEAGIITDTYGTIHRDAYAFSASESGYALWNLDGDYTSFDAVLYASDNYGRFNMSAGKLEILLDGECVFSADGYSIFDQAIPVTLDVTGKKTLEVRTAGDEGSDYLYFYLADTMLRKPHTEEAGETEETPEFPEIPEIVQQRAAQIVTCGNYRYYLFEEPLTWDQASAFCTAAGGVLACPTNADQNLALQYMAYDGLWNSYWIGGRLTKGVWGWSNGEEFGNYLNWGSGKPDNVDSLEFLMSINYDGTWDDLAAEETRGFIMETAAISGQQAEDTVRLTELEWLENDRCEASDVYDIDEIQMKAKVLELGSVRLDASESARLRVQLNGKYSVFAGTVAPSSGTSENVNMQFAVFGDGKLLYELRDIRKNAENTAFSVDVSKVDVLTVAASNNGSYDNGFLYLTSTLAAGEASGETAHIQRLADLILVEGISTSADDILYTDAYGILHDRMLKMSAQEGSRVLYNLSGNYTAFTGTIIAETDGALETDASVQIKADGETLYEISGFGKYEGPVAFEVDLTGKNTLEIVTASEDRTWIYLTDDQIVAK